MQVFQYHTSHSKGIFQNLLGVASSIVNEVIRTISYFLIRKILQNKKPKTSRNQPTK